MQARGRQRGSQVKAPLPAHPRKELHPAHLNRERGGGPAGEAWAYPQEGVLGPTVREMAESTPARVSLLVTG